MVPPPRKLEVLNGYAVEKIAPFIAWDSLTRKFELPASGGVEAERLLRDARHLLDKIIAEHLIELRGVTGFFPALSNNEDIIIYDEDSPQKKEIARFCFLRSQEKKENGNPSLADFILPVEYAKDAADYLGIFALSAGFGVEAAKEKFAAQNDTYNAMLIAALADALAEAWSAETHQRIQNEYFAGGAGIRPAFGYPCAPDHEDKRLAFRLLDAEKNCALTLTSSAMIVPAASVCGMYFNQPASFYFSCGKIDEDQLKQWAAKKNMTPDTARSRAGFM